ncbi:MAG TPA: hypothetical protein VME69_17065 [Methylocella sp.]|nr:hypothetical protein [Methylocella sp.]
MSHRTRARIKAIRDFLDWLHERFKSAGTADPRVKAPIIPEEKEPEKELSPPPHSPAVVPLRPKPSGFVGHDFGKLGVGINKPDISIRRLSEHGELRAKSRGVPINDLRDTVENPFLVLLQSSGRFSYLSDKAVVVLDGKGSVVTTYPASKFDGNITSILNQIYRGTHK